MVVSPNSLLVVALLVVALLLPLLHPHVAQVVAARLGRFATVLYARVPMGNAYPSRGTNARSRQQKERSGRNQGQLWVQARGRVAKESRRRSRWRRTQTLWATGALRGTHLARRGRRPPFSCFLRTAMHFFLLLHGHMVFVKALTVSHSDTQRNLTA